MTTTPEAPKFRNWTAHLANDPATHWVHVDTGEKVTEPEAVRLIEKAFGPDRGSVTTCTPEFF